MLPILLFDIGGTKTRLAVSHGGYKLSELKILVTPKNFEEGIGLINRTAKKIFNGPFEVAVGGIAGPVALNEKTIVNAPNLKEWNQQLIVEKLTSALGCQTILKNDATFAGLGEAVFGSGKKDKIVAYVTVSTGINGVRIVDKKITKSALGFEIGSQIIDYQNFEELGDFEELVSGGGIKRRTGKNPEEIKDKKFWQDEAMLLAFGLNNTIVHWSPDVVILGGSLLKSIDIDLVRKNLKRILTIYGKVPPIVEAKLKDLGTLYGALYYARTSLDFRVDGLETKRL